jgi:autotransporter-associated beta strand protein
MYPFRRSLVSRHPAATLFLGISALLVTATSPLWAVEIEYEFSNGETNSTPYHLTAEDSLSLMVPTTYEATQAGVISGEGVVEKTGAGSLVLTGQNTFSGGLLLSAGMLRVGDIGSEENAAPTGTGTITFDGGSIGNAYAGHIAIVENSVLALKDFSIDAASGEDNDGAVEFFGPLDFGTGLRTITLTGTGLACFGGSISGENITLVTTAGTSQVMFCDMNPNNFTGTLTVGTGITLELAKLPAPSEEGEPENDPMAISGNLAINAGATVIVEVGNQFATSSIVAVNGTLELSSAQENTIGGLLGTGTVNSDAGDLFSVGSGIFGGAITGSVELTKYTTGTLILTAASTYNGGTHIIDGTLQASNNKALGTGSVTITNGGVLQVDGGVALDIGAGNTISIADDGETIYRKVYNSGEDLANFNELTSQGAFGTKADIIGGTTGADRTVDATFSTTPFDVPTTDGARVSEIFTLTGTGGDTIVLQLSYSVDPEGLYIARLVGNEWVSLGTGLFVDGAWNSSYTAVGTYGIDTTTNTIWAITDQSGAFAAVPEPSTILLLGLAAVFVLYRARRSVA